MADAYDDWADTPEQAAEMRLQAAQRATAKHEAAKHVIEEDSSTYRSTPLWIDPTKALLILDDFDNGLTPQELSVKYQTTSAAIRNRIRRSGRTIRRCACPTSCPHCGGKL